jgi:hypothetical protein
MPDRGLQDTGPFAGHSPAQDRPLGSYGILAGTFMAACGGFGAWLRRSGRELPERPGAGDLALVAVAAQKASRLIAKDRVTSVVRAPFTRYEGDVTAGEVSEAARGRGMRRAVGELLLCPYCLGMWVCAAFSAGLIVAPRATRWTASVFATLSGADMLQIAYKKAEDTL